MRKVINLLQVATIAIAVGMTSIGARAAQPSPAESTAVEPTSPGPSPVDLVARGDYAGAVSSLTRMESADAATFRANNYDYLLGRVLEQQGRLADAAARYTAVAERASNVSEYALWRLAGIARLEGNLPLERQYLTRLRASYPQSILGADAFRRLAHNASERGDFRTTAQLLGPTAGVRGSAARDALARVSAARLQAGDRSSARSGFTRLMDGSQDDGALAAARGLDTIDTAEGIDPGVVEHVRRGRIYAFNRDWDGTRRHFQAVVDAGATPNRAEALHMVGMTYFRVADYDTAISWWDRTAREFPSDAFGIKSFYWVGHANQRSGRWDEALARYEQFISKYPTDEQVEGAYRNAIDSARSGGKTSVALQWCARAEAAKPRTPLATFAVFNRAKTLLASGDASAALSEFSRLKSFNLKTTGAGMPTSGEVEILRGVCLERLGRINEAVALYLSMPPGREEYFGNRATLRLIALGATPQGRNVIAPMLESALAAARTSGDAAAAKAAADRALRLTDDPTLVAEMLGVLRTAYSRLPAYARVAGAPSAVPVARREIPRGGAPISDRSHAALGAEFAFLGLWDEAAPELEAGGLGTTSPTSMTIYSARGGRAHLAVQQGESLASSLPRDFRVELLPRSTAELVYPAPYRDALRRFAIPMKLDPRFELSIARQESRFKPWVKSPAAARGLVQFIPETADRIAKSLNISDFDQDDLYVPEVAVRFGAKYLSDLFALFPDHPYAVAASYNGGEDSVARWMARSASKDDVDLVVAEIGYKESKDYVFRVMNNYWAYKALYTPELNPR